MQGKNVLHASAQYDATGRHRRYLVLAQHPGNDENMGDATASVMGTAKDPKVRRAERVLAIRAETAMTPAIAAQRASWEATVRAARGDALSVTVQGWHQADGTLWPVNAKVQVDLPTIGAKGEMLIAAATHSLDDKSGTTTELRLLDPKAFTPEPTVPGGQWKELRKGV